MNVAPANHAVGRDSRAAVGGRGVAVREAISAFGSTGSTVISAERPRRWRAAARLTVDASDGGVTSGGSVRTSVISRHHRGRGHGRRRPRRAARSRRTADRHRSERAGRCWRARATASRPVRSPNRRASGRSSKPGRPTTAMRHQVAELVGPVPAVESGRGIATEDHHQLRRRALVVDGPLRQLTNGVECVGGPASLDLDAHRHPGPSTPSTAARTISRRTDAADGGWSTDFCHGSFATTHRTRSSPSRRRACVVTTRCPRWGGSNVPPKIPIRANDIGPHRTSRTQQFPSAADT